MATNYVYEIPMPPVGKKNSQQILTNPKTKRPFIAQSARYKKYAKDCERIIRAKGVPDTPNERGFCSWGERREDETN